MSAKTAPAATATELAAIFTKIKGIKAACQARLIERESEIDAMLLGLVAGENVLLVGPPGTGKSMLSDAVTEAVGGTKFNILLNKFSTPDELFGPVSLEGLKADEYRRLTDGFLPTADVAFLDEIFKASSAILNTMLKVLNEGIYVNGRSTVSCPLLMCVAASNEWPVNEGQNELAALFDRFAIRRTVRPVATSGGRDKLLFGTLNNCPMPVLSRTEVEQVRAAAAALPFSDAAKTTLVSIIQELGTEGIRPGDRRLRKSVGIAKAAAWIDGATEVQPNHLDCLADVLWDEPTEQPRKAASIIQKAANPEKAKIGEQLVMADEILAGCDFNNLTMITAACGKLTEVVKMLATLPGPAAASAKAKVEADIKDLKKKALDKM